MSSNQGNESSHSHCNLRTFSVALLLHQTLFYFHYNLDMAQTLRPHNPRKPTLDLEQENLRTALPIHQLHLAA
jgi:hypothetical protein